MTHFDDFELRRWQESGPGDDRDRIVAHVAECADCAARYAAAIKRAEFTPDIVTDAGKYVSAGYELRAPRRWMVPLAAAAVLVIAVAIPLLMMRRSEAGHELRLRGNALQALSPSGPLDLRNPRFEWASGVAAARYRLEVGRADHVLAVTETTGTNMPLPPQMLSRMQPGVEYWWRVTALDEQGKPVSASERVAFFVRPR